MPAVAAAGQADGKGTTDHRPAVVAGFGGLPARGIRSQRGGAGCVMRSMTLHGMTLVGEEEGPLRKQFNKQGNRVWLTCPPTVSISSDGAVMRKLVR